MLQALRRVYRSAQISNLHVCADDAQKSHVESIRNIVHKKQIDQLDFSLHSINYFYEQIHIRSAGYESEEV